MDAIIIMIPWQCWHHMWCARWSVTGQNSCTRLVL